MRRSVLVLLVGLLAAACSEAAASDTTEDDLDGRTFVSTEVVGRRLIRGTGVEISFSDRGIHFSSGCNDTNGPYEVDGGRIDLDESETFTTTAACSGPGHPMAQERWVRDFMAARPVAELQGDLLTLTRGADVINFVQV